MFCTKCGTESPNSAGVFCFKCGAELAVDASGEGQEESPRADDQINTHQEPAPSVQRVSTTPLPGGYILGEGEEIVRNEEYVFSIALFWLKTHVVLTNRSLLWEQPNVKSGFIPMGRKTGNTPLTQIAGVNTNREFNLWKLIFGGILSLFGLVLLGGNSAPLGVIFVAVGIIYLASLFQTTLNVQHLGGPTSIQASVRQRIQVERLSNELSQTIANLRT